MARTTIRFATLIVAALCACSSSAPEIAVDTEVVDFGSVELGAVAQRTVTFTNSGSGAAALRELQVTGGEGQFAVESAFSAIDLPESGSLTLIITFRPTAHGVQTAELTLNAADVRRSIALRGQAVARSLTGPRVSVLPIALEFGDAPTGSERRILVSNVGDTPLRFGKLEGNTWQPLAPSLEGADARAFELRFPAEFDAASSTVPPGGSLELRVQLFSSALGPKVATLRLWTDDAAQSTAEVAVHASVIPAPPCSWIAQPTTLELRSPDGTPVSGTFSITTLASSAAEWCVVRNLSLTHDSAPELSLRNGPIAWAAIRRGEQLDVEVQFAPGKDGLFTGSVRFQFDAAVPASGTVALIGRAGTTPCLQMAPQEVDFGEVTVNCSSRERSIAVINVCGAPAIIDAIEIQPGDSTAFKITQKPVLPKTLLAGEQAELKVTFRPTQEGDQTQTLAAQVRGDLAAPLRMKGHGAFYGAFQTDVFAQNPPAPKIDVLFVIDESPSMADKQQAIASNVGRLVDFCDTYCIDYQLAFTTTSVDSAHGGSGSGASIANGRFLPLDGSRPRIVSASTPNHRQVALQNAAVGTSGTTPEYLFRPVELALSPPLSTGDNAGFLRPDASTLEVAIISDSADHDSSSVANYKTLLAALKAGTGQRAIVDAVVPKYSQPAGGCSYGESDAWLSTRATDLATMTGGWAVDVCEPGWWFGWGIIDSFCPRTRFHLSNVPIDGQMIRVDVDGQPYPAIGPGREVRWAYGPNYNSIDFAQGFAPPPDSVVKVTYAVNCLP